MNCLAFNLDVTKFDNSGRVDGHFGPTSKELAKNLPDEFFSKQMFLT